MVLIENDNTMKSIAEMIRKKIFGDTEQPVNGIKRVSLADQSEVFNRLLRNPQVGSFRTMLSSKDQQYLNATGLTENQLSRAGYTVAQLEGLGLSADIIRQFVSALKGELPGLNRIMFPGLNPIDETGGDVTEVPKEQTIKKNRFVPTFTTTKAEAKKGVTTLQLSSLVGFAIGEEIAIGRGTFEEGPVFATITEFGSVALDKPLTRDVPVGTSVDNAGQNGSNGPIYIDGIDTSPADAKKKVISRLVSEVAAAQSVVGSFLGEETDRGDPVAALLANIANLLAQAPVFDPPREGTQSEVILSILKDIEDSLDKGDFEDALSFILNQPIQIMLEDTIKQAFTGCEVACPEELSRAKAQWLLLSDDDDFNTQQEDFLEAIVEEIKNDSINDFKEIVQKARLLVDGKSDTELGQLVK